MTEPLREVLRKGLVLTGVGVGIGLLGALWAARGLESLLFGVSRYDPVAFGLSAVVLLGVGAAASSLPARRAARTPPQLALRED